VKPQDSSAHAQAAQVPEPRSCPAVCSVVRSDVGCHASEKRLPVLGGVSVTLGGSTFMNEKWPALGLEPSCPVLA
jgi:hypothetical protein